MNNSYNTMGIKEIIKDLDMRISKLENQNIIEVVKEAAYAGTMKGYKELEEFTKENFSRLKALWTDE